MNIRLLAEHHLQFLSIKGGCLGSSESTLAHLSKYHIFGTYMSRLISFITHYLFACWVIFVCIVSSAIYNNVFKDILQVYYKSVEMVWVQIRTDR